MIHRYRHEVDTLTEWDDVLQKEVFYPKVYEVEDPEGEYLKVSEVLEAFECLITNSLASSSSPFSSLFSSSPGRNPTTGTGGD